MSIDGGCTFDGGNVALWINGMKASVVSRAGPVNEPGSSRLTVGWGGPPEWIFEGELESVGRTSWDLLVRAPR